MSVIDVLPEWYIEYFTNNASPYGRSMAQQAQKIRDDLNAILSPAPDAPEEWRQRTRELIDVVESFMAFLHQVQLAASRTCDAMEVETGAHFSNCACRG